MSYEALVDEIVERLTAHIETLEAASQFLPRPMPDNQKEFAAVTTKARVTVAYVNSDYAAPRSLASGPIHQEERITIALYVEGRKLRGAGGVYDVLEQVKAALVGYRPQHARTRLYISGYGDWTFEQNVLGPFLEMSFTAISSQVLDDSAPAIGGGFTGTSYTAPNPFSEEFSKEFGS